MLYLIVNVIFKKQILLHFFLVFPIFCCYSLTQLDPPPHFTPIALLFSKTTAVAYLSCLGAKAQLHHSKIPILLQGSSDYI